MLVMHVVHRVLRKNQRVIHTCGSKKSLLNSVTNAASSTIRDGIFLPFVGKDSLLVDNYLLNCYSNLWRERERGSPSYPSIDHASK